MHKPTVVGPARASRKLPAGKVAFSSVVGLALARARARAGFSQLELAERMRVPQYSLSRLESGAVLMRVDQLRHAAQCLDLRPAKLIAAAEKLCAQIERLGILVVDGTGEDASRAPLLRAGDLDVVMQVLGSNR